MLLRAFRRGRLPAVHTFRSMRGAAAVFRALAPLGPAPAKPTDYVTAVNVATGGAAGNSNWGMLGNDVAGDCTFADSGHRVMLNTANAGTIIVPTAAQVLGGYSLATGYDAAQTDANGNNPTDQGDSEDDACAFMRKVGLCGQKSAGSGPVDPANLEHIKWTVQIFGACRLGITVTDAMEDQFKNGQPWETLDDNNPGGHDVPMVYYDSEYGYVITWGGIQPVAWPLLAQSAFLQESHCEAYSDFVRAGGTAPNGFDLDTMLADIAAVA